MPGSLVRVEWGQNEISRDLVIVLHGPAGLLESFTTHGDFLGQFVAAVSAQGLGELTTDSMRLRIAGDSFTATWKGHPRDDITTEHVNAVMRHVIAELG